MMERNFVAQKIKEFQIQEFVAKRLNRVGHSHTVMKKTPLGEKIIVHANRPGLVVGRHGGNIKDLTKDLKKEFNLENPQIEIQEVKNIFLDPEIVAERIANSLERFGTTRFKGIGHKMMEKILEAGALGVEIIMSGKIPGARARSWRFYQGYLKKCGEMASLGVKKSCKIALLKTGIIGIRVKIMPPELKELEEIKIKKEEIIEEIQEKKAKKSKKKTVKPKKEEKKEDKKIDAQRGKATGALEREKEKKEESGEEEISPAIKEIVKKAKEFAEEGKGPSTSDLLEEIDKKNETGAKEK